MAQDAFAGRHTREKLEAIEEYLKAFITALKRQKYELVYFDAFAGTGEIPLPAITERTLFEIEDFKQIVEGSVERALRYPFDQYYFVEKDENKFNELCSKYSSLKSEKNIEFLKGDANFHLRKFVETFDSDKLRAVVFLDPFGNQIPMDTLRLLASKPGLDVWYLFPAGLGVDRQIGKSGRVAADHKKSLDLLFGDEFWQEELIAEVPQRDFFQDQSAQRVKSADSTKITEAMINRLKVVFNQRVLTDWLPLGRDNRHWYSLLFMWSNPSESAKLAARIAQGVLRKSKINRRNSNGRRK